MGHAHAIPASQLADVQRPLGEVHQLHGFLGILGIGGHSDGDG